MNTIRTPAFAALWRGMQNLATALAALAVMTAHAQTAPKMKMTTAIPPAITTPDTVETRLGTLHFTDGFPDDATVAKLYDNLDFQRGVQAFLNTIQGASLYAVREGYRSQGATNNQTVLITETFMDSKSLFLTPSTESVYNLMWLDLKDGPLVIEMPPGIVGIIDDFWFNYVGDLGFAGPDRGKGGKFLLLPPGYTGKVPEGYFVMRSKTYGNGFFWCGAPVNGDPKPAVEASKKFAKVYLLAQAQNPPPMKFINVSGKAFNTVPANDFTFFEQVNGVVQEEPNDALDPLTLGLLASIGIEKGRAFAPDERMRKILTEAAAVGNATARAILFRTRMKEAEIYPNSAWREGFIGGSYKFSGSRRRAESGCPHLLFLLRHGHHPGDGLPDRRLRLAIRPGLHGFRRQAAGRRQELPAASAAPHPGEKYLVAHRL